jgi:acyl-[acyl-carrier-protein]-phospholipid O-acyltransferase/long-chain-fatty-acid--[acyl-carrier-protein] ligase
MSTSILLTRRFAPLFWCQFMSAFSDNLIRNAAVFLILFKIGGSESGALIALAGAAFKFPAFFIAALGGELADRYDKALVAQRLRLAEIGAAGIAAIGFVSHSLPILFLALFLFGVIAALFGPLKYGILPDHLKTAELPAGNALVEAATFLAILLGTIVGGLATSALSFSIWIMTFALGAWIASLYIPATGEGAPQLRVNRNILKSTADALRYLRTDPRLWWGAIVVSWFWLVGIVMLSLLPPLVKIGLGGNEQVVTLYLATFAIAIALGSGLASWLCAGRIIISPTLLGAAVIGVFAIDLGLSRGSAVAAESGLGIAAVLTSKSGLRALVDLAGLAIGGGLFIVPVFAAVQSWASVDRRARVIAAVNVMNSGFMVVGALVLALLQKLGVGTSALCIAIGIANLAAAVTIYFTMPAGVGRDLVSMFRRAQSPAG